MSSTVAAQPFQPVSELRTWYTDRNPVDVEVVATEGQGSEARRIEPERMLRFRLERAYVSTVFRSEHPPFSSLMISFDMPTGLPSNLLIAPPEQVERRGEKIPQIDNAASIQRTLIVRLESKEVVEVLKRVAAEISRCRGENQGNDLYRYDKNAERSCASRSMGDRNKYVARLSDELFLLVSCSDTPNINCQMPFPFEGFMPVVSFHESHLKNWKEIVRKATSFLRSTQYQ